MSKLRWTTEKSIRIISGEHTRVADHVELDLLRFFSVIVAARTKSDGVASEELCGV